MGESPLILIRNHVAGRIMNALDIPAHSLNVHGRISQILSEEYGPYLRAGVQLAETRMSIKPVDSTPEVKFFHSIVVNGTTHCTEKFLLNAKDRI